MQGGVDDLLGLGGIQLQEVCKLTRRFVAYLISADVEVSEMPVATKHDGQRLAASVADRIVTQVQRCEVFVAA